MRRFTALVLIIGFAALPRPAAAAIDSVVVHADVVDFFSNRWVVTADGNVQVGLSDGTTVTGRTFAMDLKLNRFIVAGGVTVAHGNLSYQGAAFSEFLDYRRAYFLPVLDQPDRWTFLDENYAAPAKGREMPGDAFAIPDLSREKPFIISKTARINPKNGVGFTPAQIYTLGVYSPTPDYYQNFSANPNFAQNSMRGATADAGWPFLGSRNAQTVLHLRYDTVDHGYLGIEQHLVTARSYAIFSINPMTRPQKQYNFLGSVKAGDRFQLQSFDQVSAFQSGFRQPLSSSALENAQLTYALPNSFLQLTGNQYHNSLLAQPPADSNGNYWYGDPGHPWIPSHPNNFQLAWIGADRRWARSPINYRLRAGMLTAHDGYGLGAFNTTPYTSYWQHYLGFTVWTNPLRLGAANLPSDRVANFQMTYDRQRTIVSSFPRYQDQSSLTSTLSRQWGPKHSAYVAYVVGNQADVLGPLQSTFYPPTVINNPFDGKVYPGYAAFAGLATSHDLQFGYNYTPTPYFSFTVQADQRKDFPAPIPYFYGNPPYSVAFRTRFRLSPVISVDVQRSYFFNFGNQGWSPTFAVQVGP